MTDDDDDSLLDDYLNVSDYYCAAYALYVADSNKLSVDLSVASVDDLREFVSGFCFALAEYSDDFDSIESALKRYSCLDRYRPRLLDAAQSIIDSPPSDFVRWPSLPLYTRCC